MGRETDDCRGENLGSLAREQYGSRKHLSANHQALNKRLTFELGEMKRIQYAVCSNDATGCYDNITHTSAGLSMKRMGVPTETVQCMFDTIRKLQHRVRTGYGDSISKYQSRQGVLPLQGVGQGNGAGPEIWAAISSPILNLLQKKELGVTIISAITKNKDKLFRVRICG